MPSGRVHATSNLCAMIALAVVPSSIEPKMMIELGLLSGMLLSPDLDVDDGYIGLHLLRLIHAPAVVWRVIWWPYSKLVPHRSPLSHWPILGTLLRLLYLGIPVSIICFVLHISLPIWNVYMLWWLVGLEISDTMHFLFDVIDSGGL